MTAKPPHRAVCRVGDPLCPCPDGDACHYIAYPWMSRSKKEAADRRRMTLARNPPQNDLGRSRGMAEAIACPNCGSPLYMVSKQGHSVKTWYALKCARYDDGCNTHSAWNQSERGARSVFETPARAAEGD